MVFCYCRQNELTQAITLITSAKSLHYSISISVSWNNQGTGILEGHLQISTYYSDIKTKAFSQRTLWGKLTNR